MRRLNKRTVAAFFTLLLLTVMFSMQINASDKSTEYLAFAEKMPVMQGGLSALNKYIIYPEAAMNARLEGKVFVLIFVNETGGVDDVKVVKGIGMGCDQAATEAVKKVSFSPGEHLGQKVKVKLALAIDFKLG